MSSDDELHPDLDPEDAHLAPMVNRAAELALQEETLENEFENLVKYGGKKTTEKQLQEEPVAKPKADSESDFYEEDADDGSEKWEEVPEKDEDADMVDDFEMVGE